jgi:transcriptional regulator with XRE-family HTH domain
MSGIKKGKIRNAVTLHSVVAEKLGMAPSYVKKVERGERNNEAISTELQKLTNLVEDFKKEAIA